MKTLTAVSTVTLVIASLVISGCGDKKADQATVHNMPNATPIVFAKGGTAATIQGSLSGFNAETMYSIEVNAGQSMHVMQVNPGETRITLSIYDPSGENVTDMDAGCNGDKTISPTVAGTYKIKVFECMKADEWSGPYTLKVSVK